MNTQIIPGRWKLLPRNRTPPHPDPLSRSARLPPVPIEPEKRPLVIRQSELHAIRRHNPLKRRRFPLSWMSAVMSLTLNTAVAGGLVLSTLLLS